MNKCKRALTFGMALTLAFSGLSNVEALTGAKVSEAVAESVIDETILTEEEKAIVQGLINEGCSEKALIEFKESVIANYENQSEEDRNIITEEECEILGIVYENDGSITVPIWWLDEPLIALKKEIGNSLTETINQNDDATFILDEDEEFTDELETEESFEPTINDDTDDEQEVFIDTPSTSSTVTKTPSPLVNYGDIADEELLNERVNNLLNELNAAGLYNMYTNAPYTFDELKDLILFMNGAYVPKDELDAYTMVDRFLDLVLAPTNSDPLIYAVNYQGGEDSFKDIVSTNANMTRVNFVDNILFGNSTAKPYLKWLEDSYYQMLCTTDRETCKTIFESVIQSLADMIYGNGFTLDGYTYTKNDFLGLERINGGNLLQLLVYMIEPFRTQYTNDNYYVTNDFISANLEENQVEVPFLSITEHFNPLCADDMTDEEIADTGLIYDGQEGKNFAEINQINTINAALQNLYVRSNSLNNEQLRLTLN